MKKTLEQLFGEVLKELRINNGFSQEFLANESDLDRSFISMLERGLKQPSLSTLFSLSKPLKTQPSQILRLIEDKYAS